MSKKFTVAVRLALVGLPVMAGGFVRAEAAAPAASGTPAEGPRLTSQSFGSWVYRCQEKMVDGKPAQSACALSQDVVVQQDGKAQTVMTIGVAPGADGTGHGLTALVPLGVRLKPGFGLSIDDGTAQSMAYDYCGPRGCWVAGAPIDAMLPGLKAGKTGRAKIVMLNGREVVIEFPLAGFATGLAALDASRAPVADAKPADAKAKSKAK
jgi:invasion protein IalB